MRISMHSLELKSFRQEENIMMCLLTVNALHGRGPKLTTQMFATRNTPHGLKSHDAVTLNVPRMKKKTLADCAFKVSPPNLWNADLRGVNNVKVDKSKLKTLCIVLCLVFLSTALYGIIV